MRKKETKMFQCEGKQKHFEINNAQKQTKMLQCEEKKTFRNK
jgi:hypothetical protein